MSQPIQLYSMATPNGQKIGIALEEMQLPYTAHLINITKGDQHAPEYLKINPNGKIPAIVDPDGPGGESISIFESGAILVYLAQKSGRLWSSDPRKQSEILQWLFFQMSAVGPMFGQFGHFFKYAVDKCDHPYPLDRYTKEGQRILGVLDKRLGESAFLAGPEYTIADVATVTWVNGLHEFYKADAQLDLPRFKNVQSWVNRIMDRPPVRRGIKVCQPPV